LVGQVVASLSVSRDRTAILQLFPVRVTSYPSEAFEEFAAEILPGLRTWLGKQRSKPETGILGTEQVIVEWTGSKHRRHELRYL